MSDPNTPGRRKTHPLAAVIGAAGLLAGLLTSCSSGPSGPVGSPAATVASIPRTAAAPARTTAAAVAVQGPLIRADTSTEEVERLQLAWGLCLRDQGVPGITKQTAQKFDVTILTKYPKAAAACASKRPETINDRYKREHPQAFQAHLRQFIKCMKDAGQKIIFIPPDGWGVSDQQAAAGYTPDERIWTRCEGKAYGG
jgi:hypothetical protein